MTSLIIPTTIHFTMKQRNKTVIGNIKDEFVGTPIAENICLRSKLYSILRENEQVIKKAKGVKICNQETDKF